MDKKKQTPKPKPKQAGCATVAVATAKPCKGPRTPAKPLARVPSAPGRTNMSGESSTAPRCQKRFEHIIHKHQIKNEQLEKRKDHLQHRLEMLECSMPVMLAQVCQQPDALIQLLERQFSNEDDAGNACRITPSRHYDCRVREIEAQRKEAHRRAEEARALLKEREAKLEDQMTRLELARQQQQQHKQRVEQLAAEACKLQKQSNEKGKQQGEEWLSGSEVSLDSSDLDCLRQLETLVEVESCKRRHVSELEAQNEMYMRVLARAEEIHPPAEARRQDELCKQLEACKAELARYRGVEKSEAGVGVSGPKQSHKDAQVVPKCVSRKSSARIKSPKPPSNEQACETQVQAQNKITWAGVETSSKDVEAKVDCLPACVGRYYSEANKSVLARPQACDKKSQARAKVASLALGADVSQLEQPSKCECGISSSGDKQFGTCCPPDFVGNNLLDSNTDVTRGRGLSKKVSKSSTAVNEKGLLKIPRLEIETCLSIVNDMHDKLAGSQKFPHVCKDFQNLKNIFASALGLDIHTLEKQADRLAKSSRKKQEECDGVLFAGRAEKKQQMDDSTTSTCECGQELPKRVASIGKKEKGLEKCDSSIALKRKEEREKEKCSDTAAMARKSEKGRQADIVASAAGLTCKCEPERQKDDTIGLPSKIEKRKEKCDRGVSTDNEDKKKTKDDPTTKCKEAKVQMKVDETLTHREKEAKKICQDDSDAEKRKQAGSVVGPSRKCELLQQKDEAATPASKIDKQNCGATILTGKEGKRRHRDDVEASTCKGDKQKTKDDDAVQQCKEQKRKCNDIVTALTSKGDKEKQADRLAAPTINRKTAKHKDEANRLGKDKGKCVDPAPTCKEDKKKQKEDAVALSKGAKVKLKDSDTAMVTKKEKMKTKLADAASTGKADKDKSKSPRKDVPDKKYPITGKEETISRAKILCCDSKTDQKSLRECASKRKLGSAGAQPCGSDKKLTHKCDSNKSVKAAPKPPCKTIKPRPCESRKKDMRVSSVADDKISERASLKSVKTLSKQSMKSRDKSLSKCDPEEKEDEETSKIGSDQVEGKSLNQLNPTENVEEVGKHESEDKQPFEFHETGVCSKTSIAKEVCSVEGSNAESEYFECSCDFLPCLRAAPLFPAAIQSTKDKTPFEQLCTCEPLVKIVDKWRREAAPGKLYCGYPRDKRGKRLRRQTPPQRRRQRARRRHHPYKRTASSTCLGRPRLDAKCTCSGVLPSSPSVCGLAKPGDRCRKCGVQISASRARLCGLLLAQAERQQQVISQRSQSDIACSEVRSSGKRDQGVLAKLPKPAKRNEAAHGSEGKRKKRSQTECPFEGSSRKAARILDGISSGELALPRRNVGPSCTCLKNQCYCPAADFN